MKTDKRSGKQNNSLQMYCREVAAMLEERGIPFKEFFDTLESEYTEEMIRNIFRKKGTTKYGKPHTSDFTKEELKIIHMEMDRHIAKWGILVPWHSEEEQRYKAMGYKKISG